MDISFEMMADPRSDSTQRSLSLLPGMMETWNRLDTALSLSPPWNDGNLEQTRHSSSPLPGMIDPGIDAMDIPLQ
jgi:hypothetical protein